MYVVVYLVYIVENSVTFRNTVTNYLEKEKRLFKKKLIFLFNYLAEIEDVKTHRQRKEKEKDSTQEKCGLCVFFIQTSVNIRRIFFCFIIKIKRNVL